MRNPLAEQLGPHIWNDPRNVVANLEPIMGCRPWTRASEVKSHEPCEVCDSRSPYLAADPIFCCLGCTRVVRTVQIKLTADRWPSTEPAKERRPLSAKQKKKLINKLTRKERRSLLYAAKGTAEGQKWAAELGLKAAG
jgi:hypothetical protein